MELSFRILVHLAKELKVGLQIVFPRYLRPVI